MVNSMNNLVTTIGIDLGKLIGMTATGEIALRRRVSRDQLERTLVNPQPCRFA